MPTGASATPTQTLRTQHIHAPGRRTGLRQNMHAQGSSHMALLRAPLREMRRRQPSAPSGLALQPCPLTCAAAQRRARASACAALPSRRRRNAPRPTVCRRLGPRSARASGSHQPQSWAAFLAGSLSSGRALCWRMGADAQRAASMCALSLPYRREVRVRHGFSARQPLLPARRPASAPGRNSRQATQHMHSFCQH